ncbi:MAG: hypothetical protein AB8G11_20125 [Saprospiraceae bacterium]
MKHTIIYLLLLMSFPNFTLGNLSTGTMTNPAVLPTSPTACDYTGVTSISLAATGGSNAVGETTEYVLTDISGTILQIQSNSNFTNISTADYAAYAVSYETAIGVTGLTIGQNIVNVASSGCLDFSVPFSFRVCPQNNPTPVLPTSPTSCNYVGINSVTLTITGGSNAAGETTTYALTDISGVILDIQSTPTFNNLTTTDYAAYAISYETAIGLTGLTIGQNIQGVASIGCLDFSAPFNFRVCSNEICNNGIDDDGDNLIDCDDPDCGQPTITNVAPTNPTTVSCPNLNNGSIVVTATGSNLEYSINGGTFQVSNTFSNLTAGTYTITVQNSLTGCSTASSETLISPTCSEICNNGIDDDGDNLIDCDDPDCGQPTITNVAPTNPTTVSCPNLDNGIITVAATGSNLEYSINGITFQQSNIFGNLTSGNYTITARNSITGCGTTSSAILTAPTCPTNPTATLPTSPTGCTYTNATSVNLTITGGSNAAGETTEYALTDISGMILDIQATPSFSGLTNGEYAAYAVSYETAIGVTGLTIGQNIQGIASTGCLDFSAPFSFRICPQLQPDPEVCNNNIDDDGDGLIDCDDPDCNCNTPVAGTPAALPTFIPPGCDYFSNQTITLSANGGTAGTDETIQYVLTNGNGVILQINNLTIFNSLAAGTYIAYSIAYKTVNPPANLTVGTNILSVTASCIDFSQPYSFIVCDGSTPGNCDYQLNTAINLTATNSNLPNASVKYFITDVTGLILSTSTNSTFLGLSSAGTYFAYALAYGNAGTVIGDNVGDNINNIIITGTCFDWSLPYVFDACDATEDCTNAVDDDGDGLIDCDDPDCIPATPGAIQFD